ncbi:protein kinase family protein [Bacillus sp. CGMCC 1.16541]|uniref:protein kinase domain-containing protein n=1 Tax=Bacillus sp. CGMCC 1.16541 TaxID=2185143 RepID=UPI000D731448|nr:protein kinase family protein [Bacillus sp. CGMCC 1.16541]
MNTLKSLVSNLRPGTTITGKWHQHSYRILKELGMGATGVVYLVERQDQSLAALKFSFQSMSVSAEVNVLKSLSKVHGKVLGPSLLDVDDWKVSSQHQVSFYVMEYIKGEPFLSFIKKRGSEWIGVFAIQLLGNLDELHKEGWTFGDLKPENLVVTEHPITVRWLDVGGTTLHGRSIKEFTDFYDRAHWGMGARKAEPSYDLFAVAMIMLHAAHGKRFDKQDHSKEQLRKALLSKECLSPYRTAIQKALEGKYTAAEEMKKEVIRGLNAPHASSQQTRPTSTKRHSTRTKIKVKRKQKHLLETCLLFVSVMFMYLLYLFLQVL